MKRIRSRPPKIFYSESKKKFYIKVKGRRFYLDLGFMKGLNKDEVRRYLTQLVIKKRRYHLRVKKNDVKKDDVKKELPTVTYAFSPVIQKPVEQPVPTSTFSKDKIVTRQGLLKDVDQVSLSKTKKEEVSEDDNTLNKVTLNEVIKEKVPLLIEDEPKVEELESPEFEKPFLDFRGRINLTDLNQLIKYADVIKEEFKSVDKTTLTENLKKPGYYIGVKKDLLKLFPEDDEIQLIESNSDVRKFLNKDAEQRGSRFMRQVVSNSNSLVPLFTKSSTSDRDFVLQYLYDPQFRKNVISYSDEGNLTMFMGNGHYYKDGLYDSEIEQIMKDKTKRFVPCIMSDEIPSLNKYIKEGMDDFGFVINTQGSKEPGLHWIGVYVSKPDMSVEYFDPLCENIPTPTFLKDIKPLVERFKSPYMFKLKVNDVKVQDDDTSTCGYHAMKFLIDRMCGKPFMEASGYIDDSVKGEKEIHKVFKEYI